MYVRTYSAVRIRLWEIMAALKIRKSAAYSDDTTAPDNVHRRSLLTRSAKESNERAIWATPAGHTINPSRKEYEATMPAKIDGSKRKNLVAALSKRKMATTTQNTAKYIEQSKPVKIDSSCLKLNMSNEIGRKYAITLNPHGRFTRRYMQKMRITVAVRSNQLRYISQTTSNADKRSRASMTSRGKNILCPFHAANKSLKRMFPRTISSYSGTIDHSSVIITFTPNLQMNNANAVDGAATIATASV